jgi:hypothetical protein
MSKKFTTSEVSLTVEMIKDQNSIHEKPFDDRIKTQGLLEDAVSKNKKIASKKVKFKWVC